MSGEVGNDSFISSGRGHLTSMQLSALQLQVMKGSKEYQEMIIKSKSLKIFDLRREEDFIKDAEEVDMGQIEDEPNTTNDEGMIFN